jgi:hypothetical protein
VFTAVRGGVFGAVVVKTIGALFTWTVALKAGVALSSYANDVAFFDIAFGFGTDAGGYTHDLMPDDNRVRSRTLCY